MKIQVTEKEALQIVGSLIICCKTSEGENELRELADGISEQHLDYLKGLERMDAEHAVRETGGKN